MLRFLKMTGEAVQDVITTGEAAEEVKEALVEIANQAVLVPEKKADSEATEMIHREENVLTDQEEKRAQEENRVHFKEMKGRQDVLITTTDRPDARLKLLKTEDREEASLLQFL